MTMPSLLPTGSSSSTPIRGVPTGGIVRTNDSPVFGFSPPTRPACQQDESPRLFCGVLSSPPFWIRLGLACVALAWSLFFLVVFFWFFFWGGGYSSCPLGAATDPSFAADPILDQDRVAVCRIALGDSGGNQAQVDYKIPSMQ